ncbi:hypothetical protein ACHWQZ_G000971 [Mnemiopsis leidyi]
MEYLCNKYMPPKALKPTNKLELVLRPSKLHDSSPQPDEPDSLYGDKDFSPILNVTTPDTTGNTETFFEASSSPAPPKTKAKIKPIVLDRCPCGKSDPQSTKVICAKCKQHWHNRCCNLNGLTQPMIKKLELWQCPKCYTCPIISKQPATMQAEFSAMKHQISLLLKSNTQTDNCQSINAEVAALRNQVSELVNASKEKVSKVELPPDLEEALRKVNQLSPEIIPKIEEGLAELRNQVSGIQSAMSNRTQVPQQTAATPNTESPNNAAKAIKIPCTPYVKYQSNMIPDEAKDEIMEFVKSNEQLFKSLGIAETNVDIDCKDVYRIPGYISEYNEKKTGKLKGSGVALYMKDDLIFNRVSLRGISAMQRSDLYVWLP